jgi:hypothetical protein
MFDRLRRPIERVDDDFWDAHPQTRMPEYPERWESVAEDPGRQAIVSTVGLIGSPGVVERLRALVAALDRTTMTLNVRKTVGMYHDDLAAMRSALREYIEYVRTDLDVDNL